MVSGLLMDQTRDSESETNKTSSNIQPHHRVLKFRNRFSRCPAHAPEIIRAGLWRCIENQAAVRRGGVGGLRQPGRWGQIQRAVQHVNTAAFPEEIQAQLAVGKSALRS